MADVHCDRIFHIYSTAACICRTASKMIGAQTTQSVRKQALTQGEMSTYEAKHSNQHEAVAVQLSIAAV